MEHVAEIGGVEYVNDSKATNVSAAAAALRVVRGRRARDPGRLAEGRRLRDARAGGRRALRVCYLIGEAAAQLAADLQGTGVELVRCGTSNARCTRRRAARKPGEVVLLSPACASFDQYRDFEERGEHFRALVHGLT